MMKYDFKKQFKELYTPPIKPSFADVPEMTFISVQGIGNPNEEGGEYGKAVESLYALSYAIKMSRMGGKSFENYFEYVVPPLEGFWSVSGGSFWGGEDKSKFCWKSVIRQPEFVTAEIFDWAKNEVKRKKPHIDVSRAELVKIHEGLCVQAMHIGSFDEEHKTIKNMEECALRNEFKIDLSDNRLHHEIYLSDPRKIDISKMRTVLRIPVKR